LLHNNFIVILILYYDFSVIFCMQTALARASTIIGSQEHTARVVHNRVERKKNWILT